jgi:hypothetical protein
VAASTITFTTGRGAISFSARQPSSTQPSRGIAGGLLGGDPSLVAIVRQILTGNLPKSVRVAEPGIDYYFTATRDTIADVAAAMLVAGNGRGRLSDSGWDALDAAMDGNAGAQLASKSVSKLRTHDQRAPRASPP